MHKNLLNDGGDVACFFFPLLLFFKAQGLLGSHHPFCSKLLRCLFSLSF